MFNLLEQLENKSPAQLKAGIVLLASLIAIQVQYIQHGWINPDSVLYFEAARLFANAEWKAGFEVFPWPFYALWIATVHSLTSFNIHFSAQILNVVFFAIATFSFLNIIQLAGGKQRQLIAGAIIWLSAPYMIGDVLEMLMRDEGFWAFYLTALVFFIRFYQRHAWSDAILWQVAMIVATLFRIEGFLFLILLPTALLTDSSQPFRNRVRYFLTGHSISLIIGLILVLTVISGVIPKTSLGRLNEIFTLNIIQEFTALFRQKSQIMSDQVLGKYLEEFAIPGLLLTFVYVIASKVLSATGLVHTGLAVMGIKYRKLMMNPQVTRLLLAVATIAIVNMALIIGKVFVLSSRYVLALSIILMVFAAFYLASLLSHHVKSVKYRKWLIPTLLGLLLIYGVKNVLPKREGYNHMQHAVEWLKTHNTGNAPVFYDESRLRYYAEEPYTSAQVAPNDYLKQFLSNGAIHKYHYLVISYDSNQSDIARLIQATLSEFCEIKRFNGVQAKKATVIYSKDCPHGPSH
jgi:hypothetical protein